MSEILLIVGNSNAGKDWVASNKFPEHKILKCSSSFKTEFEKDHFLKPGTCNDKKFRKEVLQYGHFAGVTIQRAMVICCEQAISGKGYGAKFGLITQLAILNEIAELSKERELICITDVRKVTELKILIPFSEVIHYSVKMVVVRSEFENPQPSDVSLETNIKLYESITGNTVEVYNNKRDSNHTTTKNTVL